MSGVGAPYSYGSERFHLVLTLSPSAAVSNAGFDDALRRMALRLARFIAALEKRNSELDIALTESESTNRQLGEVIKTLETKLNGKADKADPQPSEGIAPTVEPSEPKQENAQ